LKVVVAARAAPDIGKRWRAPRTILRMARLAREVMRCEPEVDVVFCDLVAHIVPILRRSPKARILFYCHYPDRLLVHGGSWIYRLYRLPIDWAEERGLRRAHRVVVNSMFTAAAFRRAFPQLRIEPELLYPGVVNDHPCCHSESGQAANAPRILCLNRFDPAKNLVLVVEAFARLRHRLASDLFNAIRLIVAGSCDPRLPEQGATLAQLRQSAERLGVADKVEFQVSISDRQRRALLGQATCFAYTPMEEHFGLGPVEAMAAGLPVVAVDSGGVRETVRSGETGLLCLPTPDAFADALASLIESPARARQMGAAGRAHVEHNFSRRAFGARLETILRELCG
jgi:alpha-1,3/alpha-1,6-mannosyltransferase